MSKRGLAVAKKQPVTLLKVEEARALIAQCKRVDEAKDIRDKTAAMQSYLRQQGATRELQNDVAEIKVRAERRIGDLLIEMKEDGGRANQGSHKKSHDATSSLPTISDLGIQKDSAQRWQSIARVPEKDFERYLIEARKDGEITTKGAVSLYQAVAKEARHAEKRTVTLAEAIQGRFPVIYADPPWQYNNTGFEGSAETQYPTMATDDICDMPVADKATTNAVLFMWATWPLLDDALRVMTRWGFEYKTGAPWKKHTHVGGFYFLGITELLLVGVRGSSLPRETPIGFFDYPRTKHSKKPPELYDVIERMYEGPYLELFARTERANWTAFGNEPNKGAEQ